MPPRLGHRKSRKGCLRCKQRRVKCDEQSPCTACVRHGVECIRESSARSHQTSSRKSQSPLEQTSRKPVPSLRELKSAVSSCDSTPDPSSPSSVNPLAALAAFGSEPTALPLTSQWMADLGLMHHFTTATWSTLPESHRKEDVWRFAIPKLAGDHEFLMHGLLDIAASHKAFANPQERGALLLQASQHRNSSIQGMRTAILNITEASCHAVVAAATLLSIGALASQAEHATKGNQDPGLTDLFAYITLLRGMCHILKRWEIVVEQGPLGGLLRLYSEESETPFLRSLVQDLRHWKAPQDNDLETQNLLQTEAQSLALSIEYACRSSDEPRLRTLAVWPLSFSDAFLSLARSGNRGALEVIDRYCQVMESVGSDVWYAAGWGKCLRTEIARKLPQR